MLAAAFHLQLDRSALPLSPLLLFPPSSSAPEDISLLFFLFEDALTPVSSQTPQTGAALRVLDERS